MSEEKEPLVDVPMWDLPVRLFHWLFVIFFADLWISRPDGRSRPALCQAAWCCWAS